MHPKERLSFWEYMATRLMLDGLIKDHHRMCSNMKIVIRVKGMLASTCGIVAFNKPVFCLGMGLLDEAFLSLHRFYGFLRRMGLFMIFLSLILTIPIDCELLLFCLNELIDGP